MATLEQFADNMRRIADAVEKNAPRIQRETALAALQTVVMATPVGNTALWKRPGAARKGYVGGRARANWLVGIGAPAGGVTDEEDAGGGGTISTGEGLISSAPAQTEIHITNNLDYIEALNEGHSHQAPAGFVEEAVAVATSHVQGSKVTE